jgi:putative ABC transport system ATP-binding protein
LPVFPRSSDSWWLSSVFIRVHPWLIVDHRETGDRLVPAADSAVLIVAGLTKAYGSAATRVEALRGLDMIIRSGEFVAVMGPSGSGKSSLLHLLAGLDQPTSGRIRIGSSDLALLGEDERAMLRRRQIGLIFQSLQLLDTLTAEENVALPLAIGGSATNEASQRAARMLGSVGLANRRQHRPHELSGGEQQRVAIARALVIEPLLVLADEPTGNLDSVQGERIMALLRKLVEERRQTMLMVTHDASHAAMADRIVYLRDGRAFSGPHAQYSGRDDGTQSVPDVRSHAERGNERFHIPCVECSVAPPPCSLSAIAFVAPCTSDALEHDSASRGTL